MTWVTRTPISPITGVLKDAFSGGLKALPGRLLFTCGGERRFLRRYSAELHLRHHEVPIPFAVPSGKSMYLRRAGSAVREEQGGRPLRLLAGRVTLYLDGLDELSAAARHAVVHWIKDVAR
ncbi:hypothetical protein OG453_29805 [Streptomyces sp. NBC_01381]|uniref:hypothetical protein n=1 Tax=Streptomyces sp. NBC_01381 TaxID=2903845 RepID=UPI0022554DE5|nr:hypothetical protein [Streptomyces sp. NBC_01381]MCX4670841.1 hypothetical protein [Streptomyces sp. NBC_01381]